MQEIQKISVVEQVVSRLEELILSGEVSVGEKLPTENELCQKLSVGRSTVREAFRILQAKGYVEIKPGRGAFAARTEKPAQAEELAWLSKNKPALVDCIEVRSAIEPMAVKLAIAHGTEEEREELEAIHREFIEAVRVMDAQEIARLDEVFHAKIVEMSHNPLLVDIHRVICETVRTFRSKTFVFPQNARNAIDPHERVLMAIRERDEEAGEMYMKRHIQRIQEDLDGQTPDN